MSSSLEKPIKANVTMVRFFYGTPTIQHLYCDDASEEPGFGGIYLPRPSLEVESIKVTGLLKEKPSKITLPSDAFTSWLAEDRPHPRVFCWVFDKTRMVSPTGGEEPTKMILRGEVLQATRNPDGKNSQVSIELTNWKSEMNTRMGFIEQHTCNWAWASPGCTLNKENFKETANIDSVDGKKIIVSAANVTSKTGRYWRGGWIQVAGADIRIKDWIESDPQVFHMHRQAPADWAAASAFFYPGDDKTYATCRDKFLNNDNFMGIGFSVPSYQPIAQTPKTG